LPAASSRNPSRLRRSVAKKTGKKFVLDPRVRAEVTLIGEGPFRVSYDELLTILDTYGFMATESGGYVQTRRTRR
jgi:hypothetical protein